MMFSAAIEQMKGSVRMETEYWQEVTDLDQAERVARSLGFAKVEGSYEDGWLVEVEAVDQVEAIQGRGFLIVGGNDAAVPSRIRFEMP
jgi:hypothetical protein